jgi:hypothetical protein
VPLFPEFPYDVANALRIRLLSSLHCNHACEKRIDSYLVAGFANVQRANVVRVGYLPDRVSGGYVFEIFAERRTKEIE